MKNPKVLKVGSVTAKRGEKKKGPLATYNLRDGTPVEIPVLVINGEKEGPIYSTVCGVHANEPLGTMAIINVFKMLDPKDVSGAYIGVPMATPTALQHGWRYNPLDFEVIRFPGHPRGTITQRMANAVFKEVYEPAEVFTNWHSNYLPCLAWCNVRSTEDEEINLKADKIAKSTGVTYINGPGVQPFPPVPRPGRPVLPPKIEVMIEAEGSNTMERRNMRAVRKALLNAVKASGVVEGELEDTSDDVFKLEPSKGHGFKPYLPPELGFPDNRIWAEKGGIIVKEAEDAFIGRKIKKGTVIARVYDLYGEEVETIRFPMDGYIWGYPHRTVYGLQVPAVHTGDDVAWCFTEIPLREPYKSMS